MVTSHPLDNHSEYIVGRPQGMTYDREVGGIRGSHSKELETAKSGERRAPGEVMAQVLYTKS